MCCQLEIKDTIIGQFLVLLDMKMKKLIYRSGDAKHFENVIKIIKR